MIQDLCARALINQSDQDNGGTGFAVPLHRALRVQFRAQVVRCSTEGVSNLTETTGNMAAEDRDFRILPVSQRRAMQRQRAILDAGRRLLRDVPFASLRMEQIAVEAGCSVGTLYQRFKDKDALLDVILEEVVAELDALMTEQISMSAMAGMSSAQGIGHVVAFTHGFLNANQGLLRAIVARQLRQPDVVSPLQLAGARLVAQSFETLSALHNGFAAQVNQARYQFAMQTLIGTLNNAVINRPGPYQIEDPRIVSSLSETVCLITGISQD